jgi:hypothetical protein
VILNSKTRKTLFEAAKIFDIILSQLYLLHIPTTHFSSGPENKQWDMIHKNSTA